MLVGILGEDRITCVDPHPIPWGSIAQSFVAPTMIIVGLGARLKYYYAAETITRWARPGIHCRDEAVGGIVLVAVVAVAVSAFPFLVNVIRRRYLLEALPPADMCSLF